MNECLIQPNKSLGYSDIFLDFISDLEPARSFYQAHDLAAVAAQLDNLDFDRPRLVSLLTNQNRQYDASDEVFNNIALLEDSRTVCVFAGQQAGLFGGPLLTLIKALGVVKAARLYTEQLQRPVIPIFWIAGDDHDLEEVNHVIVINRDGEPCTTTYGAAPEKALPLSEIAFSSADALQKAKDGLSSCLGETDFTPELFSILDEAYAEGESFVSAFGKFMAYLTRGTGLIFFSPGDAEVKRHSVPFFRSIIERQEQLHECIEDNNRRLSRSGYHIQVEKRPESTHLFYNLEGRTPLFRDGNAFRLGETKFSYEQLLSRIDEHPERFSPDVMTRPVLQSYLFPTLSQQGGPAEIAYLAQMNSVFALFNLPEPVYRARPSLTIVERRFESMMEEYDISYEGLTGDFEQTINRVLGRTLPEDIEEGFASFRKDVETRFSEFSKGMLQFDPSLGDFARQTFGKIDFSLKNFQAKAFSAHKRKSKETRERLYRLLHTLYPYRGMQERTLNISYFIARYGFEIVSHIEEQMDSEETAHQLLHLSRWGRP